MAFYRKQVTDSLRDMAKVMSVPCHGQALRMMAEGGLSMRQIAEKFDIPFGTVRWQAQRYGVEFPRKGFVR